MGKRRGCPTKSAVEQLVQGRARKPFFAADDVGDLHEMVVDHVGEVVGRQAVGFHQDLVVEDGGVDGDGAADGVREGHRLAGRHLEADHEGCVGGFQRGDFGSWQREAVAHGGAGGGVVLERGAAAFCGIAAGLDFFGGVPGLVGVTCVQQGLHLRAVEVTALALAVGAEFAGIARPFVRVDATPIQGFADVVLGALDEPGLVGVLDAEDEGAAVPAGEQPVVVGRADSAHVKRAGGAGGESDADGSIGGGGGHGGNRWK